MNHKALICCFLLFLLVLPGFAKDNYNLEIKQSINLPGGKEAINDSVATIPYNRTKNGEVDLAYSITVPETKKSKFYWLYFLLPKDISPTIASKDIQGEIYDFSCYTKYYSDEFFSLDIEKAIFYLESIGKTHGGVSYKEAQKILYGDISEENFWRVHGSLNFLREKNVDKSIIENSYFMLVYIDLEKHSSTNNIGFSLNIPESYRGKNIEITVYVYHEVKKSFSQGNYIRPKTFTLKVR